MSERSFGLKVGAGLSTAALALAGAGCGADGPKYSQTIEQKIERIITPSMKQIASAAIKLEKDGNGLVTARNLGKGLTEVSGLTTHTADGNNGLNEIDVVMRDFPGTQEPDLNEVVLADVGGTDNATKIGFSAYGEVELIAPGQSGLANKVLDAPVSSDQVLDTKGWTALATVYSATNGIVDEGSTFDTADKAAFSVDVNGNPSNPLVTARNITSLVSVRLQAVVDDFKFNGSTSHI